MKIALVTGGSRGLGKDMAVQLARKGLAVVITYREREADAASVVASIKASGGQAAALAFDANDIPGIDGFVQRLQSLLRQTWSSEGFDFLITNAGMGVIGSR